MTIQECTSWILPMIRDRDTKSQAEKDAMNIAIASLEAWEKVRSDIEGERDIYNGYNDDRNCGIVDGLGYALGVIDTRIEEIEKGASQ